MSTVTSSQKLPRRVSHRRLRRRLAQTSREAISRGVQGTLEYLRAESGRSRVARALSVLGRAALHSQSDRQDRTLRTAGHLLGCRAYTARFTITKARIAGWPRRSAACGPELSPAQRGPGGASLQHRPHRPGRNHRRQSSRGRPAESGARCAQSRSGTTRRDACMFTRGPSIPALFIRWSSVPAAKSACSTRRSTGNGARRQLSAFSQGGYHNND